MTPDEPDNSGSPADGPPSRGSATLRADLQQALGPTVTLGEELPRGGMSRVFAAFDETLQRKVAVKVLAPDLAESFSVDRFRREIMLVASLQHPNIVPVLSAGEVGHLPYFVMPFVEGESLRARLRRGPLSVRETVSIMRDVARALNLAHERGIVHRDIKPDNVMLTAGVATVTDFGVAKALAAARRGGSGEQRAATPRPATLTSAGTAIGTPAYMAPEQAAGDPTTDHRADLYALGILGYEMLAGTAPFHGASARELMAAQLAGTPPPLERRRGDVPPELRQLIMQCLQKAPADRPATATGVVRVLENPDLVSGSYVVPGPSRQVRRREMAGAGMMVLLLAAVAYGFWPTRAPAPDRAASGAPAAPAAAPAGTTLLIPTLQSPAGDATARQTAAGLTEQLVARLAQQPGLRVAGPPLADSLVAGLRPMTGGGRVLRLEGLVQRAAARTGLTVRLVDSAGFTSWGSSYRAGGGGDPLQVQDSLSAAAVAGLLPHLAP